MEYEDIVPDLLERIRTDFQKLFEKNKKIIDLYAKVRDGTGTYAEANEFSIEVGEMLAKILGMDLASDILPDGRMYYNIADRIIGPMMKNNYDLITDVTSQVQKSLNDKAGIGIKPIKPELNQDRIDGIVNRVSETTLFDDIAWILDEPIKVFSQSVVDDAIKANAEFQYEAGLSPKIERKTTGKCCEWCRNLAKTYMYPDVPKDVYRRHDYCRCTVDYIAGKKRHNVHNDNTGKRRYVRDQFGGYEKSKEIRIAHAKEMAATEKERKEAARQKRIATWEQKNNSLNKSPQNSTIKEKISDKDVKAVHDYLSAKSYVINEKLRTAAALTAEDRLFVKNLDEALHKMPNFKGNLQRSLIFYSDEDVSVFINEYKVGNKITYSEYLSTTKGEIYNPDGQVQIFIANAERGRDISSFNDAEKEVLYERNSSFVVVDTVEQNGKVYILLEEDHE